MGPFLRTYIARANIQQAEIQSLLKKAFFVVRHIDATARERQKKSRQFQIYSNGRIVHNRTCLIENTMDCNISCFHMSLDRKILGGW